MCEGGGARGYSAGTYRGEAGEFALEGGDIAKLVDEQPVIVVRAARVPAPDRPCVHLRFREALFRRCGHDGCRHGGGRVQKSGVVSEARHGVRAGDATARSISVEVERLEGAKHYQRVHAAERG